MVAYKYMLELCLNKRLNGMRFLSLKCSQYPQQSTWPKNALALSYKAKEAFDELTKGETKLVYVGSLNNKIKNLKILSLTSSIGLIAAIAYGVSKNGLTLATSIVGLSFTPLVLSPFLIAWLFKRYILRLSYNYKKDTYTAQYYGYFLNKKNLSFKSDQVKPANVASILSTFEVNERPFFIHDEDLIDVESISLYRKMTNSDKK